MSRIGKIAGIILCLSAFSVFALGSGDSSSSTTSVKVEANSGSSTSSKKSESTADAEMKYEITNTKFDYYSNSIGRIEYHAFVEVTNTGDSNIYMDKCTFDFEDNNGHLLKSDSLVSTAPDIIAPGEKGYFFNSFGSIDENISLDNGIKLVPQIKLSVAKKEPVDYPVSDVSLKEPNYGNVEIVGRIENDSDEEIKYLTIYVVLYDANGEPLDIATGSVSEVAAGNKGSFDITNMFGNDKIKFSDIDSYKVYARDMYIQF